MTTFSSGYQPRPLEATFGYFSSLCSTNDNMQKMRCTINLMNGLGYIPVAGTIVGIARIAFFSPFIRCNYYSKNERAFSCFQVGRGCVEMFSLGAIFLIPDLIVTIHRELSTAKAVGQFSDSFGRFQGDPVR